MEDEKLEMGKEELSLGETEQNREAGESSEFDALEADEQEMAGLGEALAGVNQLTALGNRAMELGLIVGHGYHGGQYEVLRQGKIMTLEPPAAVTFLQDLIQGAEG